MPLHSMYRFWSLQSECTKLKRFLTQSELVQWQIKSIFLCFSLRNKWETELYNIFIWVIDIKRNIDWSSFDILNLEHAWQSSFWQTVILLWFNFLLLFLLSALCNPATLYRYDTKKRNLCIITSESKKLRQSTAA